MAVYFKLTGNKKREMTFNEKIVSPETLARHGWVKKVVFDDEPEEEMEEEPIEVPSVEELQKPKRGRKPKTVKQ